MKIRADFVTNSSSVSFLLTLKKNMAEQMIEQAGPSGKSRLIQFLLEKLEREGETITINNEPVHSLVVTTRPKEIKEVLAEYFQDGGMFYHWQMPDVRQMDFSQYTDEQLWAIVCSLLHKGKIGDLQVIGATPVSGKQRVY
ncbi:MAG TPA: hypothetical protein PKA28_12050 [Methylomusa anaerophila]|uniref:Uncharacterized protein n=1 Tax=Methylomusa anaerophila TaxID=1930071 RepID=A0A348AFE3_9FIRM|nr:hypothetical protein [Methylomusa anaerophila]BBB89791.1 hypothetical protein MAMMFC1_00425 [Methylomusa anaerophila]HML89163.1 hypothetical protein [Methylomusa anaerophila]